MDLRARGRPLVIGHRGVAASAPPNSLEGLRAALSAGADIVELDVDATLHLGHPGEETIGPAPALDEALAVLEQLPIGVQIDMKVRGIEEQVASALRASGLIERAIVSSASARSVRTLRERAPFVTCAVAYPRDRGGVGEIAWPEVVRSLSAGLLRFVMPWRARVLLWESGAGVLALHHRLVSRGVLAAVHARGVAVVAWTVNDPVRVAELAAMGVDAITTDDPGMALRVLGTLKAL